MKIGIVCPYNLALPGGVQQHVFEQAAELERRGHDVRIVTPKPRGKLLIDDRNVVFLGNSARFKTPQHTSVDVSISVTTEAIVELLEKEQFDIIHIHEPFVPILARQMLPRITCPVVGTFHAAMPDTTIAKSIAGSISPFVKSIVKHLHAFTAVAPAATSYVGSFVPFETIHIIPNGINLTTYKNRRLSREKTVLYVGRLEKRKGVKHLIEAFAELHVRMPEIRLQIAGNGPDREKLEHLAEELEIAHCVDFLGYIDEDRKRELMSRCGIFVSPALYGESFGIVLVEAMASGAVVMGGNNPGYAGVLNGRGSIGLVDPISIDLFASRMELLLTDTELRKLLQAWAATEVKRYSYGSIVDAYESLYEQLYARSLETQTA